MADRWRERPARAVDLETCTRVPAHGASPGGDIPSIDSRLLAVHGSDVIVRVAERKQYPGQMRASSLYILASVATIASVPTSLHIRYFRKSPVNILRRRWNMSSSAAEGSASKEATSREAQQTRSQHLFEAFACSLISEESFNRNRFRQSTKGPATVGPRISGASLNGSPMRRTYQKPYSRMRLAESELTLLDDTCQLDGRSFLATDKLFRQRLNGLVW